MSINSHHFSAATFCCRFNCSLVFCAENGEGGNEGSGERRLNRGLSDGEVASVSAKNRPGAIYTLFLQSRTKDHIEALEERRSKRKKGQWAALQRRGERGQFESWPGLKGPVTGLVNGHFFEGAKMKCPPNSVPIFRGLAAEQ